MNEWKYVEKGDTVMHSEHASKWLVSCGSNSSKNDKISDSFHRILIIPSKNRVVHFGFEYRAQKLMDLYGRTFRIISLKGSITSHSSENNCVPLCIDRLCVWWSRQTAWFHKIIVSLSSRQKGASVSNCYFSHTSHVLVLLTLCNTIGILDSIKRNRYDHKF